jgi:hypothetical protein
VQYGQSQGERESAVNRRLDMTVLALAGHIEHCLSEYADEVQSETSNFRVMYTATVGKQAFVVTIEELAKDAPEPALT